MELSIFYSSLFLLAILVVYGPTNTEAQGREHWLKDGRNEIEKALINQHSNINLAKNIIVFVGDGLDITTTTAARILKGQQAGKTGEEERLVYESFPHVALSKTYCTDQQVTDSAASATALFAGIKTNAGTVGLDSSAKRGFCNTTTSAIIEHTVLDDANMAGKSTGIVTTSRITHATPAGLFAHSPDRNWEYDAGIPEEESAQGCIDIAAQILTEAADINVLLGGGRIVFLSEDSTDPEYPYVKGIRADGRNLIDEWMSSHEGTNAKYVWNEEGFRAVEPESTDFLLGLFEPSHMHYDQERDEDEAGEPSLAEMTETAIKVLQNNPNGFFLMVEGARIDHAHHAGVAYKALTDTLAFEKAIETALEMVNVRETLVIVTGDHAHEMSIIGYPSRGNPIFGLSDVGETTDGLPSTTLQYSTGRGGVEELASYVATGQRRNLTDVDTADPDFVQPALVPKARGSNHAGQDVGIYAIGPMAHMFHSTHEQSYVAHVMRHAACLGDYAMDCSRFPARKDKFRKRTDEAHRD